MRPAIFIPLNTREGVAEAPIEPGVRTLCEPCETGPRWKLWRLIVPAKPLPIPIPETLTLSPGSKRLDGDRLADGELGRAAELDELAVRARPRRGGRARGFVTFRSATGSNASWTAS